MPRRATAQLCENRSKLTGEVTSWGARFRYEGRRWYVTLDAETRGEALCEMHRRDGEPARLRALAGHTDAPD